MQYKFMLKSTCISTGFMGIACTFEAVQSLIQWRYHEMVLATAL